MTQPAAVATTVSTVSRLMADFAQETGLDPVGAAPRRYLWSDALAVCNYLELFRQTGQADYLRLAERLVEQVHWVLGRHRADDGRSGWISGLDEGAGAQRPTAGGLRIGKELAERGEEETFDEKTEWRRDGQYFHYLTKWMHALQQLADATGDRRYWRWAVELAKIAYDAFSYHSAAGKKKMYWKLSIDLSYSLVGTTGHHDSLDGFVTYLRLQAAREEGDDDLGEQVEELGELCKEKGWATEDPLGTGALLFDACRMAQLTVRGQWPAADLLENVLAAAQVGLESFTVRNPFRLPADYRLPFRELGLSLGIKALPMIKDLLDQGPELFSVPLGRRVTALQRHLHLAEKIDDFWGDAGQQQKDSWREHLQINQATLAASLLPGGLLLVG